MGNSGSRRAVWMIHGYVYPETACGRLGGSDQHRLRKE